MARLYTESLYSYSGRPELHAESVFLESYQMGNWSINPGYTTSPSYGVSETDGTQAHTFCGFMGNCKIDSSGVSRSHSSQGVSVMAGAGRRAEHFSRGRLNHFSLTGSGRGSRS